MRWQIIQGDVRAGLASLPEQSVHVCVTSPPYWGLRDYGCDGQIGLEGTPEQYVAALVEVFRAVRRVLRDDGTLWVNLGDAYSAGGKGGNPDPSNQHARRIERSQEASIVKRRGSLLPAGLHAAGVAAGAQSRAWRGAPPGYKSKDLLGLPWMVAFALRADGWYLRSDIIWHKPNPMPESVTDRPTKGHEYLFLLAKNARYYYDAEAIAEEAVGNNEHDLTGTGYLAPGQTPQNGNRTSRSGNKAKSWANNETPDRADGAGAVEVHRGVPWEGFTRNRRTVWTIPTQGFPGAHFATFPEALVEPCIKAGSSVGGTVLDPFSGSGTTGVVALKQGRSYVGCELNPEYVAMSRRRLADVAPLLARES